MKKHLIAITLIILLIATGVIIYLAQGDKAQLAAGADTGKEPVFTAPRSELIPTINVAEVKVWTADQKPTAAQGLAVARFAEGLAHPRSMLTLPNGDILVAETNSPPRPISGIVDRVMTYLMDKAGAGVPSANRITLLRDADGDGRAETKTAFLTGLHSPYGMALVGDTLYVANTDALMAFPYKPGDTRITAKGRKILNLPAGAPNNHWTRSLTVSPEGLLYVGVGSNSNIGENGLDSEANRAAVLEVDPKTGGYRIYASGLRNPVGLAFEPNSGALWGVVNERDMLGSDLVPDYLTRLEFGGFYGWPWNYWGGYEDRRVQPQRPELREYTKRPDYALGNHVAPLGLTFADKVKIGGSFANGAFVGLHGSWNRKPAAGYKVVFVPFAANGEVSKAKPVDVLTGFLDADGNARGRPVDVAADAKGALLVSDDVGGIIWRVTGAR
ncbi:Sorbosone dehydrogenase [Sphingobium herbicidovorans NBRC 16415]|uniref:Sorbosone dehydrogenase n=1 Tax=Sphingobium herbicidovorans (strain ATCC 700291 / DSM 11019 / CCUG 56400 / KCTC 2939 / LMG 18315 / NBRC 16415 / MH) TaxID=1219045 RepID=A0A086PCL7_SPHHM|nr:sorbosone dehydrogenase family protein [Sphingobium herbicidovorans]KFG91135.1 Sorbosone dehydrogenase [Sphingobium herbicidovorans NBRC 16415]